MKPIKEFLSELAALDIKLWLEENDLYCDIPEEIFTPEIHTQLSARKAEIINFLQNSHFKPIPQSPRNDKPLTLSWAQERLWFLDQFQGQSATYNIPAAVRVSGNLDINALEQALSEIVRRHEVLRTSFRNINGTPIQVINPETTIDVDLVDLQQHPEQERQTLVQQLVTQITTTSFDLEVSPLLRCSLLQLDTTEHVLLLTMHHIISDGWSMGVFIQELSSLYQAFTQGETSPLPELPIQYADFAVWQRQWLTGGILQDQLDYWKQQLNGAPYLLQLPTDRPRPRMQNYRGNSYNFTLNTNLTTKLQALSSDSGTTLFMTLYAAFATLLYRYSSQSDILIGSPIANRNRADIEPLIGFFVNMLVLRTRFENNPSFEDLLAQVKETTLKAYENQDVPFEQIVEVLQPQRQLSHSPLFQVMFVFQNTPMGKIELPGVTLSKLEETSTIAKFDLTLSITETDKGLAGKWEYNTDLFDASTIERMVGHFQNLLFAVVENPQQSVGSLNLLSEPERHQLLVEWNDTATKYPKDKCVHQLFEEQVEKTPDAIAVVFEDEQLTYQELNQRANQLARHLQALGVKPEVPVGICVERSIEMLVGLLGILKAGGAYVPLDPSYPQERLSYTLADSQLPILLTQQHLLNQLPQNQIQIICLDKDWSNFADYSKDNPIGEVKSNNLAYIIYTSGSTGKPKGTMIFHHGVVNYLNWCTKACNVASGVGSIVSSSFAFDATVTSLFPPLLVGGKVVLLRQTGEIEALKAALSSGIKFSLIKITPAHLEILTHLFAGKPVNIQTQTFVIGGEALSEKLISFWQKHAPGTRLINHYGPTETVVGCCTYEVGQQSFPGGNIPIGRPINNTQLYILDKHLQPVPIGVPGELYIGGDGLARGYLNRPELTSEKFIQNPFNNSKSQRLYKTGDLARYSCDGNISFLGRIDNQIKMRGFRIELGEIEVVLNTHPQIQQAVVIVREDTPGNKRLVAYLVKDSSLTTQELREFLKKKLLSYMVPSVFVALETLPLTPNGKIDRKALPEPDAIEREHEYIPPRTPAEEIIANIFSNLLGVKNVGIHDNFFELGGHSLLATQLISRLREDFSLEISLRTLFEFPTVAQLDQVLTQDGATNNGLTLPPIQARIERETLPLSWAQERLWFLNQLEGDSATYNMPGALRISGNLDVNALGQALSEIVNRHSILRTSFETKDGTPIQVIHPGLTININVLDLQEYSKTERETVLQQQVQLESTTPFDLKTAPLLRCSLLHLESTEYVLLLVMHHIVSDGWSIGVLIREISSLYQNFTQRQPSSLAELSIQYGDFAVWQRQYLSGEVLETQLNYWKQQLDGAPDLLQLPTDHPRPTIQTYRGRKQSFNLNTDLSERLQILSRGNGTTLFMTLYTAFAVLLYRYSGQEDILIGSPIANRNRSEIESLIGFFANTLVLRTCFENNPSFENLLVQVRETTLKAYEHQDVPFEKVVEALQPQRSLSHSPLFQVMFVFQNTPMGQIELPGVTLSRLEQETTIAKFDLTLSIAETEQGLVGEWEYNTDLFDDSTVERMISHFQNLLEAIVENPQQNVSTLNLLSESERYHLLDDWNDTAIEYPNNKCIHQLFEEQVEKTPNAIALVFAEEQLTYQQLNERANQLAHHLQTLGVGAEVLVGIYVERSIEMVVGLLGILKAGGAYVAFDINYPQERLSYMLSDSSVRVLLTQQELLKFLPENKAQVVCLDSDWGVIEENQKVNPKVEVYPTNLAYVIYTSGSTGFPKGTMILHSGMVNYLSWCTKAYNVADGVGSTVNSSIGFDATITSLFSPLLVGGKVVLLPQVEEIEALKAALCSGTKFSLVKITPAHLEILSHLLEKEKVSIQTQAFIIGGEALSEKVTSFWQKNAPTTRLINEYGPTETVVGCCIYEVREESFPGGNIPIGRPIANTQIYILDKHQRPVPVGVAGELYIGGDGLARGYLNRPELTREKFIQNPFNNSKSQRLYKTGDLARYLPDGNIEFLGRIDDQVKIRGFRIELGEIEAVLNTHSRIQQTVVIATKEISGSKRLVAYIVTTDESLTTQELREFLKQKLPEYMVPTVFVNLDSLPLTANGKIDRKALPAANTVEVEYEYVEPRNDIEQILANVWQELLIKEKISIHDNFFEIGGDSILSIQVVSRAKNSGIQITPKQIFQHQTIAELARVANTTASAECKQGIVTGVAPLTPIQEWFFAKNTQSAHHYNQSVLLQIPNDTKSELLEKAVEILLSHHDALRLRFASSLEHQQTNDGLDNNIPFTLIDLSSTPTQEQAQAIEKITADYQASLNLSTGPIMQVVMFKLSGEADARLLIIIHHLAVDGVSWRILLSDLEIIYHQLIASQPIQLSSKTTAFIDWALQLNKYAQSQTIFQELEYWIDQPWAVTTPLPLDYNCNKQENTVGNAVTLSVKLSQSETKALLTSVNEAYNTQINDILLSALVLSFAKWTNNSNVLIDLEGHGREELFEEVDLSRTVGWFTSLFPVLLRLPDNEQLASVIKSVKEQLRAIPNHGIGFGILRYLCQNTTEIEKLKTISTPEISFNYLGQFDQLRSRAGWEFAPESTGNNHSPKLIREHLLDVNALVVEGELQISWTYSSSAHSHDTVDNLAQSYLQAIRSIIEHCQLEEAFGYTPSDFPGSQLNQLELDELLEPIKGKNIDSIYPLSPMQQGMLFHSLYAPESGMYFEQMTIDLTGDINVAAFEDAWQKVIDRHSILRTFFVWENRQTPLQIVLKQVKLPWHSLDLQGLSSTEQQKQLKQKLQTQREQGFQFNQAPLMDCTLVRLSDNNYKFIWNYHHTLMDGWCLPIIFKEILSFYEAQLQGKTCKLLQTRPYSDYITWLNSQDKEAAIEFWQQNLLNFTAPTPLVVNKTQSFKEQSLSPSIDYQEMAGNLSIERTEQLQSLAQKYRVTLSTIVQASWALLLSRYSGEQDVVFGVTVSGRPPSLSGVENMVGLFINTLPLRVQVSTQEQIIPWLQKIQQSMVELQQYSYTPLIDIQASSEVSGGIPLFESIVVFENYPVDSSLFNEKPLLNIDNIEGFEQTNYPLTIVAVPGEHLSVRIGYDTACFSDDTIERMLGHLQTVLEEIVENPQQSVSSLNLLSESERHQLLVEWNDTAIKYPTDKCIHQLFEEQVEKTPDAIAVAFKEEKLTYQELNQRANQLAHYLQTLGVKPEVLVGICVERSIEMVVGLLGILKAGGAYVPVNPNYPHERLSYMLADSGVEVLLTQNLLLESLPSHTALKVCLDTDYSTIEQYSQENLCVGVTSDNLAYVIYTSGSTGVPKGVVIEHQSLVNHTQAMIGKYGLTCNDRILQFANFGFDVVCEEIFPTLVVGGTLFIPQKMIFLSSVNLFELIEEQKLTVLNLPASYFKEWVWELSRLEDTDLLDSLRLVIVGSEVINSEELELWFKHRPGNVAWCNAYGLTETTITSIVYEPTSSFQLEKNQLVPIGRPIANSSIYILDCHLQPVPIGVSGELYIGGDGLARGYLNRPELTSEKFIQNPFSNSKSERLYKTGDLARYLPDGNIIFIGRTDNQVKIRGFRIELGEIEAVLNTHPQVQQAVIVATEDISGNKRLVAYIVWYKSVSTNELRKFLKQKLPSYMVPSVFLALDTLPLTLNGKVDRKALPAPDEEITREHEYIPPRTEIERRLTQIWSSTLNVTSIGVKDNFFSLGGHSLLAVRLMSQIQQQFQKNLPLATLFQSPTIEQLALLLGSNSSSQLWSPLVPIQPNGSLPPMFCVSGAGGNVLSLHQIARYLGSNQPFYGLQPQGLDGETQPLKSIEEIAAQYIQAIQTIQPVGPYFLAGHSFGGHVAFEMAIQFQRIGQSVAYVGILDTSAPIFQVNSQDDFSSWDNAKWICAFASVIEEFIGETLRLSDETLASLNPEQQLNYFKEQLERIGFFPPQTDIKLVRGLLQVYQSQCQIIYTPQNTLLTPITLFRVKKGNSQLENSDPLEEEPAWGWNQFSDGEVEIHIVPGNHISMMSEPHVKVLAQKLQKSLEQAHKIYSLEKSNVQAIQN